MYIITKTIHFKMSFQITLLILKMISAVKFTNGELTGSIVEGEFSNIEDFPYSAYLKITCNKVTYACGASILNQAILLTAAHCVRDCNNDFDIRVYTGSEHILKGLETNVSSFKIHEKYNLHTKANDIALLKLEKDLKFGSTVKRIALMMKPPKYKTAVVAGWGWVDSVGTGSDALKHASQQVISRLRCTKLLGTLPVGTICGREREGRSYPERGDSGSALLVHKLIQIGIVSYKDPVLSNATIVYTDVSYFYDWIKKSAKDIYCHGKTSQKTKKKKGKKGLGKKWRKRIEIGMKVAVRCDLF